jgi:putative spermidine/putrescine transport system permease protein
MDRTIPHQKKEAAATIRRFLGRSPDGPTVPMIWVLPAFLFMVVFFLVPLFDNLVRSVTGADGTFTLEAYRRLLTDPYYHEVLVATLLFSLAVTVASLFAGYPIAYFMVRHASRWAGLIIFLLVAPLLTSIIMRTFGWRVLLARRGFVNSLLVDNGVIDAPLNLLNGPVVALVGTVHVLVAFMVLAIASSLQGVDRRLEESAMLLGASRTTTFFRITLPLTLDGIGTGFILVFMIANGSFVTLLLLGGGSIQTLPLLIYQQFNTTRDFALAAAMSNVLLATAIACLVLQIRLLRRKGVKA